MTYIIVGLGNPGEEYEQSRHNAGRIVLEYIHSHRNFSQWEENRKLKALVSEGKIKKTALQLVLPEGFMNRSGLSVKPLVTSTKKAHTLVVIYDDLDLPLGRFKISFARGSGGHKGIESIVRSIKTKEFIRMRVGISPALRGGVKAKKPQGEKAVLDFILGVFKKQELDVLMQVAREVNEALEVLVVDGRERATNEYN